MAASNIISLQCVRPARGVTAQPAAARPIIGAIAVPGIEGPDNTAYVNAQIAALRAELDAVLPPTLNFFRSSMNGIAPPTRRS